MDFERFKEEFEELSLGSKIQAYNEWVLSCNIDESVISTLDEQFFIDNFQSYMQLAEKIGENGIDMNNRFVYFDSYGDVVTLSDDTVDEILSDAYVQIWRHPEIWQHYIKEG